MRSDADREWKLCCVTLLVNLSSRLSYAIEKHDNRIQESLSIALFYFLLSMLDFFVVVFNS